MSISTAVVTTLTQLILEHELRDAHSNAYQDGLRQGVSLRLTGSSITNNFLPGTAESDAFESGARRGIDCTGAYMHRHARANGYAPWVHADPQRLADRLTRGRALADRIISDMKKRGMGDAVLIGSMSTGKIREHSDIDILVINCGTLDPVYVVGEIVETECREIGDEGIKIDCVVIDLLAENQREKWLALGRAARASERALVGSTHSLAAF